MIIIGAPLIIHPGRSKAAPFEIVDILREAGADISRTVMSHLDRTFSTPDEFLKFAETGCYSELDVFGIECSQYQVSRHTILEEDFCLFVGEKFYMDVPFEV